MTGSLVLVHLGGAIALLLWATHMVRTNVEDAYGDALRLKLRHTLKNPLMAVGAGGALAVAFQSATAVTLLVASFAGSGIVSGTTGLMAVLGADLGSAFVVKLLSYDLSLLIPVAIFAGAVIYLSTDRRAWRQFGSILVGIGLLILSLRLIGEASEPLRESRILPVVVNYLSGDPITAFLIAAVTTWLFHSSVAFVLLMAALAARGLMPAELGVVMVLGANLGGGLVAALLSRTMPLQSRAVPFGNLAIRGVGAVLALAAFILFRPPLDMLGAGAPLQVVHAHILFNAALVVLGLPFAGLVSRAVERVLASAAPKPRVALEDREASALDPDALGSPSRALANVSRAVVGSVLRISSTVSLTSVLRSCGLASQTTRPRRADGDPSCSNNSVATSTAAPPPPSLRRQRNSPASPSPAACSPTAVPIPSMNATACSAWSPALPVSTTPRCTTPPSAKAPQRPGRRHGRATAKPR